MNAQNVSDKRRLKRWHLVLYLRVFDRETEDLLGHIVDISTNGLMLVSDQPIPVDKDFHLWVEVPRESGEGEKERIHLQAHSLWSGRDVNPDFYDTGFRLVNLTLENFYKIQHLVDDMKLGL